MSLLPYLYLLPTSLSHPITRNQNYYAQLIALTKRMEHAESARYNTCYLVFNKKVYKKEQHVLYLLSQHIEDHFKNTNEQEVRIYEYCSNVMVGQSVLEYEVGVEYVFPMDYVWKEMRCSEGKEKVVYVEAGVKVGAVVLEEEVVKEGLKEAAVKVFQANSMQNKLKEKMSSAKLIFNMMYKDGKMIFVLSQIKEMKTKLSFNNLSTGVLFQAIVAMVENNFNMSHDDIFAATHYLTASQQLEFFGTTMMYLVTYLAKKMEANGDQNLYLKQERAVFLLGSVIWYCKENNINFPDFKKIVFSIFDGLSDKKETQDKLKDIFNSSDYLAFINIFLSLSNALELKDFERCAVPLRPSDRSVTWQGETTARHVVHSGMRVGISSANASDNWTFAKLMGGQVLNVTINFNEQLKHGLGSTDSKCPLYSSVSRIYSEKLVILESSDSMSGDFGTFNVEYDLNNIESLCNTEDPTDRFRMMKFALLFTGIVRKGHVKGDLEKFCGSDCLKLVLRNNGPSRSGFASSSAVATCLLQALYNSSSQYEIANNKTLLGSMVLLFENELGLKSGRQDVDGLLPGGFKLLSYPPQTGFLTPEVAYWNEDSLYNDLTNHFALIDTGIPRAPVLNMHRGLNMRHLAFLSRDINSFPSLIKSLGLHNFLLESFRKGEWERVADLMKEYMQFRTNIDPGATRSIYDEEFKQKMLLYLFESLKEKGLIHGGMFTGAMGGGVAMLIVTPLGNEIDNDSGKSKLDIELNNLIAMKLESGKEPFHHLKRIYYEINRDGAQYTLEN